MNKGGKLNSNGFTIVELLVVIVVIGILAAITIVAFNGVTAKAREAAMKSNLSSLQRKLAAERVESESFPASLSGAGVTAPDGGTYQYSVNNSVSPPTYCVSYVRDGVGYFINQDAQPAAGVCPGHSASGVALTCPTNFIVVPGNSSFNTTDFCAMKYEAKNVGGVATSAVAGTPWDSITRANAATASQGACSGCHLITENEWMTIAHNVLSVPSNWSGGAVGNGYIYSGHNDGSPGSSLAANANDSDGYSGTGNSSGSQRRTLTLTNGQVIWDFSANAWEWTSGSIASNYPGTSGWNYREWNTVALGGLDPKIAPSYGTPAASGWTSAQGLGQLYSRTDTSNTKAFTRGGGYGDTTGAGIFSLNLSANEGVSGAALGFRATK